jgi:NAD(P)H-dependent flavin oxidoreductase YrpB (nitropropane dioxygenase family)
MIRTPICDRPEIEHPIALGGMGSATSSASWRLWDATT